MTAQLLDGRALARAMGREIATEVAAFRAARGVTPGIAVVQVGTDPASSVYVGQIERSFTRAGMAYALRVLAQDAPAEALATLLRSLNADPQVHGIIVQMPLPAHLPQGLVTDLLDPRKDVDGIHPLNAGRLMQQSGAYFAPATPAGGMELLRRHGISLAGKHAVMAGRSSVVGRPMALLMLHEHATVTICHSRTPDLAAVCRQAEVLAVAVGRPGMVTGEMIRPGAVVVDFGVNVVNGQIVGDVDLASARNVAGWITPVPDGAGPLTNIMLLRNTLQAARRQVADVE